MAIWNSFTYLYIRWNGDTDIEDDEGDDDDEDYDGDDCIFWPLSQKFEKRHRASSCPSVRVSAWNNSALNGRIFVKFDIWEFFENLSRKFKFH